MTEEIYFHKEKSIYAKNWNDLDKAQVLAVIRVLNSGSLPNWKMAQLVNIICQIGKDENLLIVEHEAEEITKFLLGGEVELTKNPLPKIKTGWASWLYGPTANLGSSTFGEFIMADMFCQNYILEEESPSKKTEWLHKMIACLYRPKKRNHNPASSDYDGDVRERFNSNNLESRMEQVSSLDLEVKHAILTYFISCKNYFAKAYTHIFTKGESSGGEESSNWFTTLSHYAGDLTKYEAITETRASLALFDLNEKQKTAKKQQAEYEKMKNG